MIDPEIAWRAWTLSDVELLSAISELSKENPEDPIVRGKIRWALGNLYDEVIGRNAVEEMRKRVELVRKKVR